MMAKSWLVAKQQFWQEASRRSFLLVLFSMPLFLAFTMGFGYLVSQLDREAKHLGYVDLAGILTETSIAAKDQEVKLTPFENVALAQEALDSGQIGAYYIVDADYASTRHVQLIYYEQPSYEAMSYFTDLVRLNLVANQSPLVANRMLAGTNFTVRAVEYGREYRGGGAPAGLFMPLVAAVLFVFLMITTAGYMTTVLAAEKENRTIEIIVTSISPGQMMLGKLLGALGIAMLQLGVWLAFLAGAVWTGSQLLNWSWLQDIAFSWRDIIPTVGIALPAYFFVSALMTLIGSMLGDATEAQQAGSFSLVLLFLPIYLIVPIINHPEGPVAMAFTFFPPTSLLTIAMRSLVMTVPSWQIGVAALISLASGLILVWLVGRAFRLAMLRYGQRLSVRQLLGGSRLSRSSSSTA
ncbi:MAG: ABC transporter permease [Candidatus Promineifilaceae bacterium]